MGMGGSEDHLVLVYRGPGWVRRRRLPQVSVCWRRQPHQGPLQVQLSADTWP